MLDKPYHIRSSNDADPDASFYVVVDEVEDRVVASIKMPTFMHARAIFNDAGFLKRSCAIYLRCGGQENRP